MALAHDANTRFPATEDTTDTTTGDRTFSHAGSASAAGATVVLMCTGTTAVVTGVLYGGVAMTLTQSATDTTEAGRAEVWTLTDIPTGTQTVTLQGCTATVKFCTCSTVTVAAGKVAVISGSVATNTTTSASPTASISTGGVTSMGYAGFHTGSATPGTAGLSTTLQNSRDYGQLSANTARRTATASQNPLDVAIVISSDDWCAAGVAFAETDPPAAGQVPYRNPMVQLLAH